MALLTTYYNIVLTIGLVRLIKQVELLLFNKILPEADIGIENEELIFKVVKMMGNAAIIIGGLGYLLWNYMAPACSDGFLNSVCSSPSYCDHSCDNI